MLSIPFRLPYGFCFGLKFNPGMVITKHAEKRIRKRMGVPRKAVPRIVEDALEKGKMRIEYTGSFRRYLDAKFLQEKTANNMRIFHDMLFLFNQETLITVYLLPEKYRHQRKGM